MPKTKIIFYILAILLANPDFVSSGAKWIADRAQLPLPDGTLSAALGILTKALLAFADILQAVLKAALIKNLP